MSKFTQGKWKLSNGGHVYVEGTSTMIADVRRITSSDLELSDILEQSFANARLIANAPEMYDVMCEVAYFLEQVSSYDGDHFAAYARMMRETLANIDGEQEAKS